MRSNRTRSMGVGLLGLAFLAGLLPVFPARAAEVTRLRAAVTGDVRNDNALYSVVFYYSGKPPESSQDILKKLADKLLPGIPVLSNPPKDAKLPFIGHFEETAPLKNYPIPAAPYFKFAGRGLSEADIAILQKTPKATEIVLVVPAKDIWKWARAFTELAASYAAETQSYLWDSSSRECFTLQEWKTDRLDTWPSETQIPELARHVTIHLYRPDDASPYARAITLGMEKFGLPDIVIEQLIGSDNRSAGSLINLTAQYLAENPVVANGRSTEVGVAGIKNERARKTFQEGYLNHATGKIILSLLDGNALEGDPANALIELDFGNYEGGSGDEKRELALSQLWGTNDSIKSIHHDDEILNASRRAREHLPELRKLVLAGFKPGERLLLKAPFQRDDQGNEWMWVEVMDWKAEEEIKGILQNDPFYIAKLKSGAPVVIKTAEVFDYILYKGDGTEEGNETGRLIEQREGEVKNK